MVRFGMNLGWQGIHAPHAVEWNVGDEFEPARKASEAREGNRHSSTICHLDRSDTAVERTLYFARRNLGD